MIIKFQAGLMLFKDSSTKYLINISYSKFTCHMTVTAKNSMSMLIKIVYNNRPGHEKLPLTNFHVQPKPHQQVRLRYP